MGNTDDGGRWNVETPIGSGTLITLKEENLGETTCKMKTREDTMPLLQTLLADANVEVQTIEKKTKDTFAVKLVGNPMPDWYIKGVDQALQEQLSCICCCSLEKCGSSC